MPENWKTYKLKDLTTKIGSGATPRGGKGAYKESGISLIRSQNVLDFRFSSNGLAFIDNNQAAALNNVTLESQDVLLNITGDSVARVCKVPDHWLPARVNQHVAIIRANEDILNHNFLLYSLLSKENKNLLLTMAGAGATRNALTKTMIEEFEISIPEINEQKTIASILSALDEKIELNLQMNKTLEEMALALYKHWFVDFGPFQDREFVDSELGEIPKGWGVKPIQSIVKIFKQSFKPQNNPELNFLHYSIPSFDKGKMPIEEKGVEMKSNKTLLNSDRILVSKLNPRFPRIWTVFHKKSEKIAVTSPEFINYEVKKSDDWSYANFLFRESGFYSKFHENATGSTGSRQRVLPSLSLQFLCAIPPVENRKEFNILINPLLKRIDENLIENQTLTQLRDTLLPKLISGEVRVKDVEKTLSEVL